MVSIKRLKRNLFILVMLGVLAVSLTGVDFDGVFAQDTSPDSTIPPEVEVVNPYFTIERFTLDDGTVLEKSIINGPPEPPLEFVEERAASIQPLPSNGLIPGFPSYSWAFGCSAVSGAMIAGYYDRNGYPNMYSGPTNNGVMPLTDTSWSTWSDGYDPYPNNPLIASHKGVDGRAIKGSIDDYWVRYGSAANDPYITGGWPQHTWSNAIGDYMKTSQSAYDNPDGSTAFWGWISSSDPMTCSDMEYYEIDHLDGTYGRKLFYESRGYTVSDCFNQKTDNNGGGFTLSDFQDEIDAGHPVLLNLYGHSIVGYGYSGSTIYIRDTWSSETTYRPIMQWGGSYMGMALLSVSVVRLNPVTPPPTIPSGLSASDGVFADKVRVSWNASSGATSYKVFRNTSNNHTGQFELTSSHPANPFDDFSAMPGVDYFYWVKACNSDGCSDYSNADSGYALAIPAPPTGINATDGAFTDRVQISWSLSDGATYYKVYKNASDSTGGATALEEAPTSGFIEDNDVVQGETYFYWVQGCNLAGCSDFSSSDSGYAANVISPPSPPTGVDASDGTYMDKVQISWNSADGAAYYEVYWTATNSPPGSAAPPLMDNISVTTYDDFSATPNLPYYYWVKACNSEGCSNYSDPDEGWREVNYIFLSLVMR